MGEDDMIGMWYWFEDMEEEQRKSEERRAKEREWRTGEVAAHKYNELIDWFTKRHGEWVQDNKLISWAEKLGIKLNHDGMLDEEELFRLFVLAILWNNSPTYPAEKGERVFKNIKDEYTLSNFRDATYNCQLKERLKQISLVTIQNFHIFNLLMFIANENNVRAEIRQILTSPKIGDKESDLKRLRQLWDIFNNTRKDAYLTVKTFLIFREIRIQFRDAGKYQYHPAICCVPDSNVRKALAKLGLIQDAEKKDFHNLVIASRIVAEHFCKDPYELYDLPLFFWHKEKIVKIIGLLNYEHREDEIRN